MQASVGIETGAGGNHCPHQLCDTLRLHLAHDLRAMGFDCLKTDRQPSRDFLEKFVLKPGSTTSSYLVKKPITSSKRRITLIERSAKS
jgi:hypothetical protein